MKSRYIYAWAVSLLVVVFPKLLQGKLVFPEELGAYWGTNLSMRKKVIHILYLYYKYSDHYKLHSTTTTTKHATQYLQQNSRV